MSRATWSKFFQNYEPWFFLTPALFLILIVVIYPVVYGTIIGFFDKAVPWPSDFVGLKNFTYIITDNKYQRAIVNTLKYTISSVTISFSLGLLAAVLVNNIRYGASFFRIILIIPMTIAPLVVGLTWRWMMDPLLGFINWLLPVLGLPIQTWLSKSSTSLAAVVLVDVWMWYPLIFLILSAGLSSLPRAPYEAAQLDGASGWRTFRRITLPLLRPVILVALLLRTVDAFRTFNSVRVLTDGGPAFSTEVLSLYLYRMGFKFFELNKAGAGAMLMMFGISIITGLMLKYLYDDLGGKSGGR